MEYLLVDALHDAKVDVVVANPARVRDFAKGHGYFEKSDAIDAQMLQLYGKQVKVSLAKPRTLEDRYFIALSRRRSQLLQLIGQENNRLRRCVDAQAKALIQEMVKALKTQLNPQPSQGSTKTGAHIPSIIFGVSPDGGNVPFTADASVVENSSINVS